MTFLGGWPGRALEYIMDNGIANGNVYRYEGWNNTCRKYLYPPIYYVNKPCVFELKGDEEQLRELLDSGPVIGAIGTTDGFVSYSSGIFYDPSCPKRLDHAIVRNYVS